MFLNAFEKRKEDSVTTKRLGINQDEIENCISA